jgi:hypothetical protein
LNACFEKLRIFLNVFSGNAISETQILKISGVACPQIPLVNSRRRARLTYSAITYYPGRRARKMGPSPLKKP